MVDAMVAVVVCLCHCLSHDKRGSYIFVFFLWCMDYSFCAPSDNRGPFKCEFPNATEQSRRDPKKKLGTHKRRHGGWCDSGGEHAIVIPERGQRIQDSPKMSIGHVYDCDCVCVCACGVSIAVLHTRKKRRVLVNAVAGRFVGGAVGCVTDVIILLYDTCPLHPIPWLMAVIQS